MHVHFDVHINIIHMYVYLNHIVSRRSVYNYETTASKIGLYEDTLYIYIYIYNCFPYISA